MKISIPEGDAANTSRTDAQIPADGLLRLFCDNSLHKLCLLNQTLQTSIQLFYQVE